MLLFAKFRIRGHSMSPVFNNNDLILASIIPFFFQKPKVNDIVVAKYKGKIFVKRIAKIKNENYFLKGDNKKDSLDSRKIGHLPKKNIIGKVIYKLK